MITSTTDVTSAKVFEKITVLEPELKFIAGHLYSPTFTRNDFFQHMVGQITKKSNEQPEFLNEKPAVILQFACNSAKEMIQ